MLQSIQYIGSGPPTYIYSNKAAGASDAFYHVFATETRGYRGNKHGNDNAASWAKKQLQAEKIESEEEKEERKQNASILDAYQKEYGRRESFLWKQR